MFKLFLKENKGLDKWFNRTFIQYFEEIQLKIFSDLISYLCKLKNSVSCILLQ